VLDVALPVIDEVERREAVVRGLQQRAIVR
jgi:hypothetical protein